MKAHTFREWYQVHNPRQWHMFRVRAAYRELGWKYFGFTPWRMLQCSGFVPELWYYLKCRFWKKYNVVRVRSLPPTWVDRDRLLLHAAFQILCDVVEGEDWFTRTGYQDDSEYSYDYRDNWQEIATLYDWWVNRRPARLEAEDTALTRWHEAFQSVGGMQFVPSDSVMNRIVFGHSPAERDLSDTHQRLEEVGEREDEEMLVRLCRIRGILWT